MDASGYHFDELESSDDQLRFLGEYGTVMYMDSWKEAKEWLEGVVFDDPAVSNRVEKDVCAAEKKIRIALKIWGIKGILM